MKIIWIITLFLLIALNGEAQEVQDTVQDKKSAFRTMFSGKPGKAALYSLVLPGAGQIYNGRWWKAPLVWGAEGYMIYDYLTKRSSFNDADRCYQSFVREEGLIPECGLITNQSSAFNTRNQRRQAKEYALVYFTRCTSIADLRGIY